MRVASVSNVGVRRWTRLPAIASLCAAAVAGCAIPPGPVNRDTVPQFDLCLCVTAQPPRSDRGQCVAELARRSLTCDEAEWAAYWARRGGP